VRFFKGVVFLLLLPLWVRSAPGQENARFRFVDVTRAAGLERVVHAGRTDKDHLLDSAGTGIAWLDYDRDGFLDIYVVNAWKVSGSEIVARGKNALYRNRGDGTFEDVTESAGVAGEGRWGSGVAVADFDSDGWPDIFVTNFGPNILYRNLGDGRFENVAGEAGVEAPGWNTGASLFDADGDGDLDLYVAAYIDATTEEFLSAKRTLLWKGTEKVAEGPFGLEGARDHFFVSDGKGRFSEATADSGLEDKAQAYGFGVRAADFDRDGALDIYVANDSDANYLYRNRGNGTFEEVGLWTGAAFRADGAAQAGMGVAVGDADGDGNLDVFVTNFSEDFSTLYLGEGRGFFQDQSVASGVSEPTFLPLSWGTVMADLDNDGDSDIVIANGHIYPQVDLVPDKLTYRQRNTVLENVGGGRFVDATDQAGPGFGLIQSSRGLAAGDYDNDGDLDLLLSHLDEPPTLLRNDSPGRSWLTVVCSVPPGEGTMVGARVEVTAGDQKWTRDVSSSGSYLSVNDPRLHFGLADAEIVDRVEVFWPDGSHSIRKNVPARQLLRVVRGTD